MLKKFIQHISLVALFTVTLFIPVFAADYQVENQPQVIEQVLQFEQKGILKQKANGYLYLDVSNDYIKFALPLIEAAGKLIPPSHYTSKKGIGAHISVIYENEQILNEIWEIAELGQEYSFTVKELRTVKLNKNNQIKKLWLLAVDAPDLERLRESYGLRSKLQGHDFHISLCTQVPGKPEIAEATFKNHVDEEELIPEAA